MRNKPKTIAELYAEFNKRYRGRGNEIINSQSLITLYGYLSIQMHRDDGRFYHVPMECFCDLLKRHLQYDPSVANDLYNAAETEGPDCRLCNWVETCSFLEYGLTEQIRNCKNFMKTRR